MSSMIKNTYSFIINAKGVSIFMSNFLIARFVHNREIANEIAIIFYKYFCF